VYLPLVATIRWGADMLKRIALVVAALPLFAGCAIHPVPEDVTGVTTYHIVRQIRCETRQALIDIIKDKLSDLANDGSTVAQQLLLKYQSDPESIAGFHVNMFQGPDYVEVRSFIKLFADAAIAYNFDLTMTENNDLSADISLLKPLTNPKFTLGISAGAKRKRSNERTFTVADDFTYLIKQLNTPNDAGKRYCDRYIVGPNYIYPIAGRIGVDKTIRTFMELTLLGGLAKLDKPTGPPTMTDKLTFTTALSLSATPQIEFAPVNSTFHLASGSLTGLADRTDQHQVTVGLAIGGKGLAELGPSRGFVFAPDRRVIATASGVRGAPFVGLRVTGGSTPAQRMAVEAIDQVKSKEIQLVQPQ
jgi:hypothetical protein